MQQRRLRLRSASQGSAPAPAAQRHSTATKENQEHPTRVRTGNSVSPLDKTYHGGPQTSQSSIDQRLITCIRSSDQKAARYIGGFGKYCSYALA